MRPRASRMAALMFCSRRVFKRRLHPASARHDLILGILAGITWGAASSCAVFDDEKRSYEEPILNYFVPAWGPDDVIMFDHAPLDSVGQPDYWRVGLYTIRPDGTGFSLLTLRPGGPQGLFKAAWSPDGRWVALNSGWGQVFKMSVEGLDILPITLSSEGRFFEPTWNPDGTLIACSPPLYSKREQRGIYIVDALGGHTRKLKDVDGGIVSWSPEGSVFAVVANVTAPYQLALFDTLTNEIKVIYTPETVVRDPRFSPDGTRILFWTMSDYRVESHVMAIHRDGSNPIVLVADGGAEGSWSPDGSQIVYVKVTRFSSDRTGNGKLWIMNSDGRNRRQLTF